MLLSDRDITAAIAEGRLGIEPYDEGLVQPSSIDVRLDRFFRVFNNARYTHIDPAQQQDDLTTLVEPPGDEPFVLHPGEFVLGSTLEVVRIPDDVAARLEGKALALDTPVPTPAGWRTMGELAVGDEVFDEHGAPCRVLAATGVLHGRPCRQVELSDGSVFTADAGHLWATTTRSDGRAAVRTTDEIAGTLTCGGAPNHHIALAGAARYPTAELPVDPYVLGVRLGGGRTSGGPPVRGLPEGPPVPAAYRTADVGQRLALLQGLMDSAGRVDERGNCEFTDPREQLAAVVHELAASLGLRPVRGKRPAPVDGIDRGPVFAVTFGSELPVFRRPRELAALRTGPPAPAGRAVRAVREVPTVPVRCIQVAAPSGLFLVGEGYVPTHNSSLGRLGLLTHSTAGFVDPGFSGHITLELSNVANLPITLWPGMKIGQLCLFRLTTPARHPYGSAVYGSRYQDQRGPTPSRSFRNFTRAETRRPAS